MHLFFLLFWCFSILFCLYDTNEIKEEDKKLAHLVSFFTSDSKEILVAKQTATKRNEMPLVQEMIQSFPLKDMIITLDALHTQSKTCKDIIACLVFRQARSGDESKLFYIY